MNVKTKKQYQKNMKGDELLEYVAQKIKGRDLFPEKTKAAKQLLKNVKVVAKEL